jgi:tetratricopeptide (TPR) repeat protein
MRRPPFAAVVLSLAALLGAADAAGQLRRGAVLSGTVTSVEGGPVAGARVSVAPGEDGAEEVAATTTDGEGRYQVQIGRGLPGELVVRVEAEGFEPIEGPVSLKPGWEGIFDVKLLPMEQVVRQRAVTAYNAGVQAVEREDLEAAARRFEEAIGIDPDLPEARFGLAEVRLRQERPAEAAEHVRAYLELRPDDAKAHRLAFEAYRLLGDLEGMAREKAVLAAGGPSPEVAQLVYNQGVEAFRAKDFEEALARFEEALELDPELSAAAAAIATLHYERGRYEEAAREAAALLELDPEDVKGRRLRFLALEAAGSPEAEAALAAYAEVDPEAAVELLAEWAKESFEADRREDAERQLLRLLAISPDHPEAHYRLGLVYAGGGRPGEARQRLRRFLELAPDHPEAPAARRLLDEL